MGGVFVTGANGFIGSRIVRRLVADGHEVVALVGQDLDDTNLAGLDVERRTFDLTDAPSVRGALEGGQLLIHSAALYTFWNRDPALIYRVNVEGTRAVLGAAKELGYRKVVYTSSAATLMPSVSPGVVADEGELFDLRRFEGHYKCSKVLAELVALRAGAAGLPIVIVHPTTVLGEGDRRPTPTGMMIVRFLNGQMKATVETVLNIVDVEDVARGHLLALERGQPGHRYVLGGENCSLAQVLEILSDLTGIPAPRLRIPKRPLLMLGRINELLARHLTHRPPLIDVESVLHALANRPISSEAAQREIGYRPSDVRPTLRTSVSWFLEEGFCPERTLKRIRRHGGMGAGRASAARRDARRAPA